MMNYSIKFQGVTKKYKMHSKSSEKLKDILSPSGFGEDFYALRNVSFEAQNGDVVGIVGVNGSGKSTMSNLMAGVTPPTAGEIETIGQVSLIAIAAGLNQQLTGRENIELKCLMMGLTKAEIKELEPEIIEFADIGKFIDMPVKKYSSGMKARLGFAISVSVDPDILVIDEALSVGDQTFADKCLKKMNEFKQQGKTIFFVSHALAQVKQFCTKVLWLEYGEVRAYGPIEEIMPQYEAFLNEYRAMNKAQQQAFKEQAMKKQAGELVETGSVSRVSSFKRKKPRVYMFLLAVILCMSTLGYIVHSQKARIVRYIHNAKGAEQTSQLKPLPAKQAINPLTKIKVHYVNVEKARIRQEPNLDSKQIATVDFATPIIAWDARQDPNDNTNWLKVKYNNGAEGWISAKATYSIPLTHALKYGTVLNQVYSLVGLSEIVKANSVLGRNKAQANAILGVPQKESVLPEGALTQYNKFNVLYNSKSIASRVDIEGLSIPIQTIVGQLGNPHLKDETSSGLLYRTDKYDFVFYASGSTINKLSMISIKDSCVL
ncbi:teichoic acids export ABC transporter ATP-binding subunit TagH [Microbacteriaceae bacterium 4G12]